MSSLTAWDSTEMMDIIDRIIAKPESEVFHEPVPWKELGLVDYLKVIKHPCDLSTVKKNLKANKYPTKEHAVVDIRQIWQNAMVYNALDSSVYIVAQQLSSFFEQQYSMMCCSNTNSSTNTTDNLTNIDVNIGAGLPPPTLKELTAWVEKCNRLTPEQLGEIIVLLQKLCPYCLSKTSSNDSSKTKSRSERSSNDAAAEMDINVDLLSGPGYYASLQLLNQWVGALQHDKDLFRLSAPAVKRKSGASGGDKAGGDKPSRTDSSADIPPAEDAGVTGSASSATVVGEDGGVSIKSESMDSSN